MKNPPFELFRVVMAVAESKNFSEAAQKLGITQPSVSMKLRELERQLPLPLFQLEGKRKVLTHYGRALYEIAKSQNGQLEERIERLHRTYASAENLTIRIAGRNEVLDYLAPHLNFDGKIELINCSSRQALNKLMSHETDVAIGYHLPDSTEIVAKKIFQSKSYFAIHDRLLGRRKLSLDLVNNFDFLKNTPCAIYHREGHMLGIWLQHLELPLAHLNIKFVTEDWRTVQKLVEAGLGYALVPEYVRVQSRDVQYLEMPSNVLPTYTYFALFEKGLKQIKPFREILEFRLD
jgi:DNA-binding transcriptional LysR family regulator